MPEKTKWERGKLRTLKLFTDITFYQIMCEVRGHARSPIGYHHLGTPFGFTPKLHAWSGRYTQLFQQIEDSQ